MKIIKPFEDAEQIWLGKVMGLKRKSFKCINRDIIKSNNFYIGITIFQPGEGCIIHNHLGAEEVNYIISGGGSSYDANNKLVAEFTKGDILFFNEGEYHRNYNNTEEPLVMFFAYSPHGELPIG
nr:cupin domain-containing protein [Sedimentibacter sp.]